MTTFRVNEARNEARRSKHLGGESGAEVTVIIRTLGSASRRELLKRAINSVRSQRDVKAVPLLVVNGAAYERGLIEELRSCSDVALYHQEEANPSKAVHEGRSRVATEFFGFLDDDDVYLPEALSVRLEAMRRDPSVDVAVTNGFRQEGDSEQLCLGAMSEYARDPLEGLFRENWLASCGALYRTAGIPVELFEGAARYWEWTYFAFRLALTKRIHFIDQPTYRIGDTPSSLSKSEDYRKEGLEALQRIMAMDMPAWAKRRVRLRYGAALHDLSVHYLRAGNMRGAWRMHLRSLLSPKGVRYFSYTRRLFT